MSYDIYGNPLQRGHCEVHPHVHEEYPCSVCIQENNNRNAHKQSESDHYEIMRLEHELYLSQQRIEELEAQVPKWISIEDKTPDVLEVRIKLIDGSEVNCWTQSDGEFYWKGGGSEMFILEHQVTHWMPLPEPPKEVHNV